MANEFIARNGLIALNNTTITGSLTVTGSQILVPTSSTPQYSFIEAPNSGFTRINDGSLQFIIGGNSVLSIYSNSWRFAASTLLSDSSTGNPFLGFRSGNQNSNAPTNYLRIQNATTGSNPKLLSDSTVLNDVSLDLAAKGTGSVNITTGSLNITSIQTATGSIARTMLISSSLSASANNDQLIGLEINPAYVLGSFTGVSRLGLVSNGISKFVTPNTSGTGIEIQSLANQPQINFNQAGNATRFQIRVDGGATENIKFIGSLSNSNFNWYVNSTTQVMQILSNGNTIYQNGGTFTDNGYRLQVVATGSDSGSLFVGGTDIASSGIARTMLISSSLSASANNDTLVALDINPSYNTGSFTGVTSLVAIRTSGDIIPSISQVTNLGSPTKFFLSTYTINLNYLGTVSSNAGEIRITQNDVRFNKDIPLRWSQTIDSNGTRDVGLRRFNTGSLEIYDGTTANGALANRRDLLVRNLYSTTIAITGSGTTSATTNFLIQNATPTPLLTVQDNGQYTVNSPIMILPASQSGFLISQSISSSAIVGGQVYGVNITPTFYQTTVSQTETAFRVAATFTGSSTIATSGSNIIADFGATSVGTQFSVNDIVSGSIYMVNDVSGLPIIEATSDWTVNMYNYPTKVLQKTGSQVIISGSLWINASGSFSFPLTSSINPPVGSAFWSGSFLYIYDGIRYRSSSFA